MRIRAKILQGSKDAARWSRAAVLLAACLGISGCANLDAHKDPPAKKDEPAVSKSSDADNGDDTHKMWGQMRATDKESSGTGLSSKSREIEKDLGLQ